LVPSGWRPVHRPGYAGIAREVHDIIVSNKLDAHINKNEKFDLLSLIIMSIRVLSNDCKLFVVYFQLGIVVEVLLEEENNEGKKNKNKKKTSKLWRNDKGGGGRMDFLQKK
jgi:hypothetical protein